MGLWLPHWATEPIAFVTVLHLGLSHSHDNVETLGAIPPPNHHLSTLKMYK